MDQVQYQISTPIGRLYLVGSGRGLHGVYFSKQKVRIFSELDLSKPAGKIISKAAQQLQEYFNGERKQFAVDYELSGTDFQKRVWAELAKIPFGKTVSYRDIAQRINNPKAVRAVGSANGKNPVCVMIPCHRVIAANGTIGGYSGGLSIKRKLLRLEQVNGF